MNYYRIFKITSIWLFMLLSFMGGKDAFASLTGSWTPYKYMLVPSTYNTCVSFGASNTTVNDENPDPGGNYTVACYYFSNDYYPHGAKLSQHQSVIDSICASNSCEVVTESNEPHPDYSPIPDPSECTLTSANIVIPGDSDLPNTIWVNGCEYNRVSVAACYSTDSWVTKRCSLDLNSTGNTREQDPTCTPEDPCIGTTSQDTDTDSPTPEQVDDAETAESHPDYDQPSDTAPDVTEYHPDNGDMRIDMDTSDGCNHEIIIKPDGTIVENISGTDCQVIIFDNRDFGDDNITYNDPSTAPQWSQGSTPGTAGSTGGSESVPGGITPTPSPTSPGINSDDTPDVTCDPLVEDCDGKVVGLLSDIKELLSFSDETIINQAATEYDQNLQSATDDLEAIGSQQIEIDGFNIDNLVKNVLKLPTAPPSNNDTFVLSGDFHVGNKEVRIENMYEKMSMMRTFLKWVFFIFTCYSCYHILFSRPLV